MIKDRKYAKEFLFKRKHEQTVTDVLCYYEQRELETRYTRKSSLVPPPDFKIRPPEDFFTKELLEQAKPELLKIRIRETEERIREIQVQLEQQLRHFKKLREELDDLLN